MCFAPDGGRVLTACRDGQASLWDWQSGHLVCSPGRHSFKTCAVAFSGTTFAVARRLRTHRVSDSNEGRNR